MLIFGKTLIVLVDAQELRRLAFTNLFTSLLSGKDVLLIDCVSVESIVSAQIFPVIMKNTAPLFILNAGALRLGDPQIARDIALLRLMMPKCLVLVMVDADWNGEIDVAVSLAINGVVSMSMPPKDVIAAIEIARMGGTYFPKVSAPASILGPISPMSEVMIAPEQRVSDRDGEMAVEAGMLANLSADKTAAPESPASVSNPDGMTLSRRQIEVLKTLQSGLSNKEIARSLGLSEATIKIHVSHLMRKFGVANRTQVAVLSRQGGMFGQTADPSVKIAPSL